MQFRQRSRLALRPRFLQNLRRAGRHDQRDARRGGAARRVAVVNGRALRGQPRDIVSTAMPRVVDDGRAVRPVGGGASRAPRSARRRPPSSCGSQSPVDGGALDAEPASNRGRSQTILLAQPSDLGNVDAGFAPAIDPARALVCAMPSNWRSRRRLVSNSANTPSMSRGRPCRQRCQCPPAARSHAAPRLGSSARGRCRRRKSSAGARSSPP
jgi:hypothetical protein